MTPSIITDITDIHSYIFDCGRNAVFTLEFAKTGARFTYRARRGNAARFFFLDVLTGPENESDYSFIGSLKKVLRQDGACWLFSYSHKSDFDNQHPAVVAVGWFFERVNCRRPLDPEKIKFYHSGRCSRCGRFLTTPESLQRGMGPKCAEKARGGF